MDRVEAPAAREAARAESGEHGSGLGCAAVRATLGPLWRYAHCFYMPLPQEDEIWGIAKLYLAVALLIIFAGLISGR